MLFDYRPLLYDGGVGEEAADDGAALGGFLYGEEGLARYPAVGYRLVVCLAGALAHYYVHAVVLEVEALAGALYAVAEHCYSLALEYFTGFFNGKFRAGDYGFLRAPEIEFCHNYYICVVRCDNVRRQRHAGPSGRAITVSIVSPSGVMTELTSTVSPKWVSRLYSISKRLTSRRS